MGGADSSLPEMPTGDADLVAADLGIIGYDDALSLQRRLHERVAARKDRTEFLLLLEHEPVITIGRSGRREHILFSEAELLKRGVELKETERGGDVTFHGPGQIVGYPIVDLERRGGDVVGYLRKLEGVLIEVLGDYNIASGRSEGFTGVWVGNEKVAAIGVAARKWVAMHGFALNVNVSLDYFNMIVPCGISDRKVTNMERILGRSCDMKEVKRRLIARFAESFGAGKVERLALRRNSVGAEWLREDAQ
ncbi:MAG TPA: lipoyl(octanoyl) transferase LipB [Candidatus Brocadiia bacterium]|nr:lipoyl(octanoyl) transferase LipB [Candidatus Brocadiia bacterium]